MPAQLVALSEGPSILIDKPILLLGRHPECDVQIESRKISRRHCCIAQVNDYLVVRDLDSTNGIRINGVRVIEGRLRPGDEVTIGSHRYQVSWDEAPNAAPPPVVPRRPAAVSPVAVDDDEALEACDEPVPLSEPVKGDRARGAAQDDDDDSVLIPENLQLLPKTNAGAHQQK
jgi:pSer/pThr/pTyr-binding forkhead associated (FHA) protein